MPCFCFFLLVVTCVRVFYRDDFWWLVQTLGNEGILRNGNQVAAAALLIGLAGCLCVLHIAPRLGSAHSQIPIHKKGKLASETQCEYSRSCPARHPSLLFFLICLCSRVQQQTIVGTHALLFFFLVLPFTPTKQQNPPQNNVALHNSADSA